MQTHLVAKAKELGIDRSDLPLNYGWAELLYEQMYPGVQVTDCVEFAPEKWSHFPAQRNFMGNYGTVFNCLEAHEQETHG
ncbi:MAG: hypothetical protein KJ749_02200, partial [Planctomycetes bacterium]|nr:hypothetical protein [Planctomycetota bacterium]